MTLKGHDKRVLAVTFSPDDQLIVSGSEDKTVKIWDAVHGFLLGTLTGHTTGINAVAFSPDGKLLASSSFNVEHRLWNTSTGESLGHIEEFEDDDVPQDLEQKSRNLIWKLALMKPQLVIPVWF
jgi:WD40 repeat protein